MQQASILPASTHTPPHYIVGSWGHLFAGEKSERMTRIVLDAHSQKLIHLSVLANRAVEDSYREGSRAEAADVEDSLLNANGELFDNPTDYGLASVSELPAWLTGGFSINDVVFYRPDPNAYGAITVSAVGVKIEGYSAHREMALPFMASDLYTAEALGKELELLIFESTDVLNRREKIVARISALLSAAKL
ncbi:MULTISPECIES: hypothetical protein [Pseudomonas]|uniref:hypothetical protein n=1 Tax=Pseudomonas TaxID=286 RepID=UPI0007093F40|nr:MULTISPECIES: hypothetical protein [Pseudomonas]KQW19738.1 hypothetical protein ASC85_07755 [Pseudomonas sp. Root401]WHS57312.1 hypothetical protein QLH64_30310 [Pseudomonas brassicacearum]